MPLNPRNVETFLQTGVARVKVIFIAPKNYIPQGRPKWGAEKAPPKRAQNVRKGQ